MWFNLIAMVLKIVLNFVIPLFFLNNAQRELYERRLRASIYLWERKSGRSVKLRDDHRTIEERLDQRWEEKWGSKSTTPPATSPPPTGSIVISGPASVAVGEKFVVELTGGSTLDSSLWRDRTWKLADVGGRRSLSLVLFMPGERVEVSLKVGDTHVASHFMKVE